MYKLLSGLDIQKICSLFLFPLIKQKKIKDGLNANLNQMFPPKQDNSRKQTIYEVHGNVR